VSAVGMLHHVAQRVGLAQLGRLVRPGGMLLVVGLARSRSLRDFTRDGFDSLAVRRHTLSKGVWETPVTQDLATPTDLCRDARGLARRLARGSFQAPSLLPLRPHLGTHGDVTANEHGARSRRSGAVLALW
jgi:hypothetical protein